MKFEKIHEDHRGSIHAITGDPLIHPEVSFLETKTGLMRGGCIHNINSEHLVVIQGEIVYFWKPDGCCFGGEGTSIHPKDIERDSRKNCYTILKTGQTITIDPNIPHYIHSITDSIIMEWGCTEEEKKAKHEEFRKIVLDHNEGLTK